jgi:DNA-binding PadR family transcriptional regulator
MEKFKSYAFNLKPMGLNEPSQGTGMDTSLFNMFRVLECLNLKFEETGKPVNYTAIEECTEKLGLHGSRYIYAALRKARDMGFVKFIERKSGGTWKLYAPTMRGIVAAAAFSMAFAYRVPELYGLIMEQMVSLARLTVETLRKWMTIMDREGVSYDKNHIESIIRVGEYILSAFREDIPGSSEELVITEINIGAYIVSIFKDWFRGLVKELEKAGVPKETVDEIISPNEELAEYLNL